MQRARKKNLDTIGSWVKDVNPSKINRPALARKAMLVMGCSREKAHEYIRIILGDEK